MLRKQLLGSLVVTLCVSCAGTALTVGEDPADTGGSSGGDGDKGGDGDSTAASIDLPCDIFRAEGHPCVAAHSTVRRLRSDYDGPLYQLCLSPSTGPGSCEGDSLDIEVSRNGTADAAAHAEFCGQNECAITIIYDQSGNDNHLEPAPPGSANTTLSNPAEAMALPTMLNGREAYGVKIEPTVGYRAGCNDCTTGVNVRIPVGDAPETIYMVTSQEDLINGCCFDYGNAEITSANDGNGTAEAVYFGQGVIWGTGSGTGPWVMGDFENGLFPGWENGNHNNISTNTSLQHEFVTAILVGDTADKNDGKGRFALYGGKAFADGTLATMYDGIRPERPGYVPMMKQGSIILGIGGDHSSGSGGRFYEGAMVTGAASKETLDKVHAAIVEAKYGE